MSEKASHPAVEAAREATQLGLDLAQFFRFGLPIKMTLADFKAKWGVVPNDANALYMEKARAALLALDAAMEKGEILSALYKGDRLSKTEHSAIICHEDTAGVLCLEEGESVRRVLVLPIGGD